MSYYTCEVCGMYCGVYTNSYPLCHICVRLSPAERKVKKERETAKCSRCGRCTKKNLAYRYFDEIYCETCKEIKFEGWTEPSRGWE
jgi:ribosomal protein S14